MKGGQFYKRNPFKQNIIISQNFAQIEKKVQKRSVVVSVFETPYFSMIFKKHLPIGVLKIKSQLPT